MRCWARIPTSRCCGCASAAYIRDRLAAALGPNADPDVIDSLELLYAGALVRAGMGYASYADIAHRLERSARLILG